MKSITLKIPSSSGHELHARLELPIHQKPAYYAIFAHCFTCSSNLNAVKNISRSLTQKGIGVIRFDFTGLGRSGGNFADSYISANVKDLVDVHEFITANYEAPRLLVGHSLGGAAVLMAAAQLEAVKAVVTIGTPSDTKHTANHFASQVNDTDTDTSTEVNIGGRPFTINQEFVADFQKTDLLATVKELRKAILILHAPQDNIVDINHAQKLYHNAFHPKSFVSLDQADHLLTKKEDSLYAGDLIGSWANRYISPPEKKTKLQTEGEQVVGHLDLVRDNFTTTIATTKHQLVADEPASVGGDDFGPSPYEYLNGGLAACTAMTLKMYARRKKWDLQEVYVYLSHSKKHVEDATSDKPVYLDHIQKKLKFVGDLDETQRNRLKEIASRCPVHRTLLREIVIETEVLKD